MSPRKKAMAWPAARWRQASLLTPMPNRFCGPPTNDNCLAHPLLHFRHSKVITKLSKSASVSVGLVWDFQSFPSLIPWWASKDFCRVLLGSKFGKRLSWFNPWATQSRSICNLDPVKPQPKPKQTRTQIRGNSECRKHSSFPKKELLHCMRAHNA